MDRIFDRLTIKGIMSLFSLVMIVLIAVNGLFLANSARNQVQEEIGHGLRDQVEAAAATINSIIDDSNNNVEKAKLVMMSFMDNFRWGEQGSGYLFVNEANNNTMIYHPYKPELSGQPTIALTLSDGSTFIKATQQVARTRQAKLVFYEFANPATGKTESKATYIYPLKQPGWVLCSGVYITRAEQAFSHIFQQVIIGIMILLVCVVVLILMISRYFSHKIGWIQKGLQDKFGGDMPTSASRNEIAQLEHGVGVLFQTFNRVINVLGDSSARIAGAAAKQQMQSKQATSGMTSQKNSIEEFATSMNEMVATVAEVANNSNKTADELSQVKELALNGESCMKHNADSISELACELSVSGKVIGELEQDSKQIESVLNVINDIAEQTNLLALNAAIEAARAGEQGRGFAVVADEVRELARRTTHSTSEIREVIEQLQTRVSEVVQNIASSIDNAETSVNSAKESQEQISTITQLLNGVVDMTTQIAAAAEEQSLVSEEMNKNIVTINEISSDTHVLVEHTDDAAKNIHEMINQVYQSICEIKISDPTYHIRQAKMAHQLWLGRIVNFLADKEHLGHGEGTCHTSCALGQWYTEEALPNYRHIAGVKELEQPHKAFHAKIKQLQEAKIRGQIDVAEKALIELVELSEQVIERLDQIGQNIAEQDTSMTESAQNLNLAMSMA